MMNAAGLSTLLICGSLLCGCVTISSKTQARDIVSRAVDISPGTPARVETFNGSIEVSPSTGSRVEAEVARRGEGEDTADAEANRDAITVTLEIVDGVALLRAVYSPSPDAIPGGSGASVTLGVPPGTALELVTSNGPITVRDTAAGVNARTSNGPVRIEGPSGPVSVETSNGPVSVKAADPVALAVHTSNGGVTFEGSLQPGEATLETSNGRVEVKLPADSTFTIDATTSAGKATSEFDIQGNVEDSALRGTVGAPADAAVTSLTIHTSNGPIALKQG